MIEPSARVLSRRGMLLCLVGPSAGGKTTLGGRLLVEFSDTMRLSVSATSRSPRSGEQDGIDYIFLTRDAFSEKVAAGEFFEWEENHGQFYGTLRSTVEQALAEGTDLLLDIDIRGALRFRDQYPDAAVLVFIVPPGKDELVKRMRSRSQVSEDEVRRRLASAEEEYRLFLDACREGGAIDYFIVNDELESAYELLKGVVLAERARITRQQFENLERFCTI